jgi:hypothetical protein
LVDARVCSNIAGRPSARRARGSHLFLRRQRRSFQGVLPSAGVWCQGHMHHRQGWRNLGVDRDERNAAVDVRFAEAKGHPSGGIARDPARGKQSVSNCCDDEGGRVLVRREAIEALGCHEREVQGPASFACCDAGGVGYRARPSGVNPSLARQPRTQDKGHAHAQRSDRARNAAGCLEGRFVGALGRRHAEECSCGRARCRLMSQPPAAGVVQGATAKIRAASGKARAGSTTTARRAPPDVGQFVSSASSSDHRDDGEGRIRHRMDSPRKGRRRLKPSAHAGQALLPRCE